jgi:hypothetical protein
MSVKHMSEAMLKFKYEQLTKEIEDCYDFLARFPTSSPLGRASIKATIRRKAKQLKKIKQQIIESSTKTEADKNE